MDRTRTRRRFLHVIAALTFLMVAWPLTQRLGGAYHWPLWIACVVPAWWLLNRLFPFPD